MYLTIQNKNLNIQYFTEGRRIALYSDEKRQEKHNCKENLIKRQK
jgi:hypothetical protein